MDWWFVSPNEESSDVQPDALVCRQLPDLCKVFHLELLQLLGRELRYWPTKAAVPDNLPPLLGSTQVVPQLRRAPLDLLQASILEQGAALLQGRESLPGERVPWHGEGHPVGAGACLKQIRDGLKGRLAKG